MSKSKREKFDIACQDGKKLGAAIGTRIDEHFAHTPRITRNLAPDEVVEGKPAVVTHIPSGWVVLSHLRADTQWKAKEVVRRLRTLPVDWSADRKTIQKQIEALTAEQKAAAKEPFGKAKP